MYKSTVGSKKKRLSFGGFRLREGFLSDLGWVGSMYTEQCWRDHPPALSSYFLSTKLNRSASLKLRFSCMMRRLQYMMSVVTLGSKILIVYYTINDAFDEAQVYFKEKIMIGLLIFIYS